MKTRAITHLKLITGDRSLLLLSLAILFAGLSYVLYILFSVSPDDVTLWMRYSAYSEAQFYKDNWYHMYSFAAFGFLVVVLHIGIMAKLKDRDMRALAICFGWLTLLLIAVAILIAHSVLSIGHRL